MNRRIHQCIGILGDRLHKLQKWNDTSWTNRRYVGQI